MLWFLDTLSAKGWYVPATETALCLPTGITHAEHQGPVEVQLRPVCLPDS